MSKNTFESLKERGYIYQATHEEEVKNMINGEPVTFYLGIDPTADSLHIGHFFALMLFRHLQEAGHRGILLVGGATAMIGDPTGKSDMRKMITKEEVLRNVEEVKTLAKRFVIAGGDNPAIIVNNADWTNSYSYIDFMRDVGIHFNINVMLAAEAYANRLAEGGLTFLEMGYMLMQAYDFVYLNKNYGCKLQIGGSDQWGNIVAGSNLGRKLSLAEGVEKDEMYGLTNPLLVTSDGKKMGKTETGTLWVAREKTTVFDFYQYFYNVKDEDTETLLRLFTRVETDKIVELCKNDIMGAKRLMAFEVTKLVHGENEAQKAQDTAISLFVSGTNDSNMPQTKLSESDFGGREELPVADLLVLCGLAPSKAEAKRLIVQGGISAGDEKVADVGCAIAKKDLENGVILKKGKKVFHRVTM
ncbi:MAG: tyrosine--tRNA ligase [Oscillospiraceae bacterium]|nr:tyrosine--tRNA ligase [Oscillospiraceae bacterium]